MEKVPAVPSEVLARRAEERRQRRRAAALAGCGYAVLVLLMWGAYTALSGFPYETAPVYTSETGPLMKGFLYGADAMRIQMSTFYHLPYLIGEALGIQGSYLPYQVVYALLWWARGLLVFLILRKFLPESITVCFAVGALVLVHSADGALGWAGQMNQFGYIFWLLLAFFLATSGAAVKNWVAAILFIVGAGLCEYMCLWSYESALPIILFLPLTLLFRWRSRLRLSVICLAWYSVPLVYIRLSVLQYLVSREHNYQQSVLREVWTWKSIAGDWLFNIWASLRFWDWHLPYSPYSKPLAYSLAMVAALVFVAGGFRLLRLTRELHRTNPLLERMRTWWYLLGTGLILVVLSFPAFLVLNTARGLWRTQFLSGIGAGLVLASLCGLIGFACRRQTQVAVFLALGGIIAFYGTLSALQRGALHRSHWDRYRFAVREILQVAPSVQPGTVIVLTNVPKDADPFGHDLWMDLAVRLAYPGIPAAGVYFYSDRTPGPGNGLKLAGKSWQWSGGDFTPAFLGTEINRTVIVDYQASGKGKLVSTVPDYLCDGSCAQRLYRPESMISGPISSIALRRFRL